MGNLLIQPSFQSGFARSAGESAHPELWRGLVGAWVPALGIQGPQVFDVSGFNSPASLTNMDLATDWVISQQLKGYTLDIDGVDQHLIIGTSPNLVPKNAITVAIWFKFSGGNNEGIISDWTSSGENWLLWVTTSTDKPGFIIRVGNSNITVTAANAWADGKFHLLIGKWSGGSVKFSVDAGIGERAVGGSSVGPIDSDNSSIEIGRYSQNSTLSVAGAIGPTMIWGREITDAEEFSLYLDPLGFLRLAERPIAFVSAAPPAAGNPWYYYAQQAQLAGRV